jgi:hypothetical protein
MLATVPFLIVSLLLAAIAMREPSLRFNRRRTRADRSAQALD